MFSNPFIVIIIVFGFISLATAAYMDGVEYTRTYNFNHTIIAVLINWALIFGAVAWAMNH